MGVTRRFFCSLLLAALAVFAPRAAVAEEQHEPARAAEEPGDKARARAHFERGIEAYGEERFKDAIDAFLEANRIYPSPALSYNTARAYEHLGDVAGALRFYRDYLRRDPGAPDRQKVQKKVSALELKLRERGVQQVTILSDPTRATVVLDGQPVGVTPWTGEIFPGEHRVELRFKGYQETSGEFELPAHRAIDVHFELQPAPAEAPPGSLRAEPADSPTRSSAPQADAGRGRGIGPVTWVLLGAGVASIGGAVFFEIQSASSEDEARTAPDQIQANELADDMEREQLVARILAGVGGALTIAGGVFLTLDLTSGDDAPATTARIGCYGGPCGVVVDGEF